MKTYRHLYLTLFIALAAILLAGLLPAFGVLGQDGKPPASPDAASPDAVGIALGSDFTYQGYLQQGGAPVDNVACDFYFALWTEITGGNQLGTLTLNGVNVNEGVFTVQLDFGNVFTGDGVWLETAVQCPGDASYTTLLPRQPITAVPYALSLRPGAVVSSPSTESVGLSVSANDAPNQIAVYGEANQAQSVAVYVNSENNTAVFGNSGAGRGVWGQSTDAAGVFGISDSWAGVWGESAGASGVVGVSAGEFNGGVYGENTGQGYGVYGKAPNSAGVFGESTAWIGVYGKSTDQTGVVGESSSHDGVRGTATAANRIGVKGLANETGAVGVWGESAANTGVYGQSGAQDGAALWGKNTTGGIALKAEGNAVQSRDRGGLIKAMALIEAINDGGSTDDAYIVRCYSGVTGDSFAGGGCGGFDATTLPTGSSLPDKVLVDFGFPVNDRFIMVNAFDAGGTVEISRFLYIEEISGNTVTVHNNRKDCSSGGTFCLGEQMDFFIFVY